MKYYYCEVEIELIEENLTIILKKDGKELRCKLNKRDYVSIYRSLREITSDNSILDPSFIRTCNIIQQFRNRGLLYSESNVVAVWNRLGEIYLRPYRILYNYTEGKEKDCKALRDFFRPIEYALRSIKSVMEIEIGEKIQVNIDKVV